MTPSPRLLRCGPVVAAALAALCWPLPPGAAAGPAPRPNIVFIIADDLGVNDLGVYGRRDHRTPRLDRLGAEGVRFTAAYAAASICSPSRAALMTGLWPARLHITTFLPGRRDAPSQRLLHPEIRQALPLDHVTLAEHLGREGYATAAIGKWHLGGEGFGPRDQGFATVHAGRANTTPTDDEGSKGEMDLTAAAERFIEAHRSQPFFLFLSHNNPHIAYEETPGRVAAFSSAFEPAYAAVVERLDQSVGRLLDRLDALGQRDNTIVVFTSDNGGLHVPELRHARVTHNTPFRAGKGYLYEGGLRVPALVRWPGRIPAGRVDDAPFVNMDWLPTLLSLVDVPAARGIDGVSQAARLRGKGAAAPRPLFWHQPHYTNQGGRPSGAVRDGNWKLVEHYDTAEVELFDLARDRAERDNRAEVEPARTAALKKALADWRRSVGAQENVPNPKSDPAAFDALYVSFDPSRFDPATATGAEWERIAAWRKGMNAAVAAAAPASPR